MSKPNELREQAWRLVYAAKYTINPKRRRMLIGEAFELSQRAALVSKWQAAGARESMRAQELHRLSSRMIIPRHR